MEPSECGVKVCAWEPKPSEFKLREAGRFFALQDREPHSQKKAQGVCGPRPGPRP